MILVGALFLALALLLAGNPTAIGRVIAGGILFLLGYASVVPDLPVLNTLPTTFLAVSAGFIWLGLAVTAWGVRCGVRQREGMVLARFGEVMGQVLLTCATVVFVTLLYAVKGIAGAASWRGVVAGVGLGGTGLFLILGLSFARIGRGWRWLDHRRLTRWSGPSPAIFPLTSRTSGLAADLLFLAAVVVPHFGVAALCIVAGTFLLHDALRPLGKVPRWGLQPFIVLIALLAATWFMLTIAGGELPLTTRGLLEAPFSAAAEMALAPIIALAAWALLGLWPLHGTGPASALAFLGGLLLLRWGNGIIPAGMEHLAPVAGVVAVLAAMHAASLRRSGELAAALGVLAVVPSGGMAWPLFILGAVPGTLWMVDRPSPVPGLDRHQLVGVLLLPALAWALPTMLRGETVLTVVALVAGVALFLPSKGDLQNVH